MRVAAVSLLCLGDCGAQEYCSYSSLRLGAGRSDTSSSLHISHGAPPMAKSNKKSAGTPNNPPSRHHGYGWSPDLPDHRDHLYAALPSVLTALPPKMDLRPQCPPVYDQGQLGSCTANSIGAAFEFDQVKQSVAAFMPSRLFIYYNERVMEGTVSSGPTFHRA
jgi:hypothetical protein